MADDIHKTAQEASAETQAPDNITGIFSSSEGARFTDTDDIKKAEGVEIPEVTVELDATEPTDESLKSDNIGSASAVADAEALLAAEPRQESPEGKPKLAGLSSEAVKRLRRRADLARKEAVCIGETLSGIAGLVFCTALFLLAAGNWFSWDAAHRIAFFGGFSLLSGIALLYACRDDGSAFFSGLALSHGLSLGLFLAVLEQTYPTGAPTARLFFVWAALLTLWFHFVRRQSFFLLWFVVLETALFLGGVEIESGRQSSFIESPSALLEASLPAAAFAAITSWGSALWVHLREKRKSQLSGTKLLTPRVAAQLPHWTAVLFTALLPGFAAATSVSFDPMLVIYGGLFAVTTLVFLASRKLENAAWLVLGLAAYVNAAYVRIFDLSSSNALLLSGAILINLVFLFVLGTARRWTRVFAKFLHLRASDEDKSPLTLAPAFAAGLIGTAVVLLAVLLAASVLRAHFERAGFCLMAAAAVVQAANLWLLTKKPQDIDARRIFGLVRFFGLLSFAAGFALAFFLSTLDAESFGFYLAGTAFGGLFFSSFPAWTTAMLVGFMLLEAPACEIFTYGACALAGVISAASSLPSVKKTFAKHAWAQRYAKHLFLAAAWGAVLAATLAAAGIRPAHEGALVTLENAAGIALFVSLLVRAPIWCASGLTGKIRAILVLCALAALTAIYGLITAPVLWLIAAMADLRLTDSTQECEKPLMTLSEAASHFVILFALASGIFYWTAPESGGPLMVRAATDLLAASVILWGCGSAFSFAVHPLSGGPRSLMPWASLAAQRSTLASKERDHAADYSHCAAFKTAAIGFALKLLRPSLLGFAVLIVCTAFFAASILRSTSLLENGTEVRMTIAPSDPRDIVLGDFMTVRCSGLSLGDEERQAVLDKAGIAPEEADEHRFKACLAFADADGIKRLKLLEIAVDDAACPADTDLRRPYLWAQNSVKLPDRWFFESGESARFAAAREAALKCSRSTCILTGLLAEDGSRIASRGEDNESRFGFGALFDIFLATHFKSAAR